MFVFVLCFGCRCPAQAQRELRSVGLRVRGRIRGGHADGVRQLCQVQLPAQGIEKFSVQRKYFVLNNDGEVLTKI